MRYEIRLAIAKSIPYRSSAVSDNKTNKMNRIKDTLNRHIKSGGELLDNNEKEYEMLVNYVKSRNGKQLITEVSLEIDQDENSGIDLIYEMFYDINNTERFGIFFVNEFRRGFKKAKNDQNPDSVLAPLLALGPVYFKDSNVRHQILSILFENTNSPRVEITHYSINFLKRWFKDVDLSVFKSELNRTQENLKHKNWKIRYMTFLFMQKFDKKIEDVSISLIDKFKGKLGKPHSIK